MLPESAVTELTARFEQDKVGVALDLLPEKNPGQSDEAFERYLVALIKLSDGDLDRLEYFVDRGRAFPGDIFVLSVHPKALGTPNAFKYPLSAAVRL